MLQFDALLFDLDGTLIDTAPDFITSLKIQLQRHGMPAQPDEQIRAGVTNGSVGLIRHAFGIEPDHENFAALRNEFLDIYFENLANDTRLFDGMADVLERCDQVQNTKPHPESVNLACGEMGVAAQHCIMIGDHCRDVDAGRAAGSRTIAAAWGYIDDNETVADWQADWTLHCPTTLYPLLFENCC